MAPNTPHATRAHSWVSPSGLERALACPAAPSLIDSAPPEVRDENSAAGRGERIHEKCEAHLRAHTDPLATDEDAEPVRTYLAKARELIVEYGGPGVAGVHIEHRVTFSKGVPRKNMPPCGGTMDLGLVDVFDKRIAIVDLKTGFVPISAEENVQLGAYAIGMLRDFAGTKPTEWTGWTVELVIIQPTPGNDDTAPRESMSRWGASIPWLKALEVRAKAAILASVQPNPEAHTGEHCVYCAGAAACPARNAEMEQAFPVSSLVALEDDNGDDSAALDHPALHLPSLPLPDLSRVLRLAPRVREYLDACEERALALGGVDGFKVVAGRAGARKWASESAAVEALRAQGVAPTTQVMKSPAAVEREVGKGLFSTIFASLAVQTLGRPTLAPEDDPRPALDVGSTFPVATLTTTPTE